MNELINGAGSISAAMSNVSGVVGQVISRFDMYQTLKADEDAYIRLLYLEVLHNLELLNTISLDKLIGVKHNDAAFKSLMDQLSLEVMAGLFVPGGKQNKKVYNFLAKNGTIKYTNQAGILADQENKEKELIETTVLKTIVFLVTKIEVLQKLANAGKQDFMKDLRLKTRVKNIKIRLNFLRGKLREYDKLEKMV